MVKKFTVQLLLFSLLFPITNALSTVQPNVNLVTNKPNAPSSQTTQSPQKHKLHPVKFIIINVESEKKLGNFSSFSLEESVWFDVVLPSLQVELVLMFNSSAPIGPPVFEVKGTFCLRAESKSLFVGLKGPVSKMISRKDLLSLKARTDCNSTANDGKPRFYLNAIPTSNIAGATGTLYVFLLNNQTVEPEKPEPPKVILTTLVPAKTNLSITTIPVNRPSLINNSDVTLKRAKRDANQTTIKPTTIPSQTIPLITTSIVSIQINKTYNFSEVHEKLRLSLMENEQIRQDCNATIQLEAIDCQTLNQTIQNGTLDVELSALFEKCNKTNSVNINGIVNCPSSNNTNSTAVELKIVGVLKDKEHWYEKTWLIKWIPIGICVFCIVWVCGCYISLLRNRRNQMKRHSFQRNTALQRTNSDPAPRRTMSNSEVAPQTSWD